MKSHTSRSLRGQIIGLVTVLVFGALALFVFIHRQYVVDQVVVWQFQPTSDIVTLADRTTMTEQGRFVFYASQPAVEDAADFNANCGKIEQSSAVLGCYAHQRIYVYNVTDSRLDGIRETTIAHEMLHAVYQRLSDSQRQTVNRLVEAEYAKLQGDKDFSQRMALYARTEPGERDNELHSIIGTEVASISPQLENYYKQYFVNRQAVVGFHDAYSSIFADLSARKAELEGKLTSLAAVIDSETKQYNDDANVLNNDAAAFNTRAANNGFSSRAEFDSRRAALLSRIQSLQARRGTINANVAAYQALYAEYEAVAGQTEALNHSIDSTLAPSPSL